MKLHWSDKYALTSLPVGDLQLWIALYLHSNNLLRCHPSFKSLTKGLGKSKMTLTRRLNNLEHVRAVIRVKPEFRLGEREKGLTSNQRNVYQLTGIVCENGVVKPLVFMKPEDAKTIGAELRKLRPEWDNDFFKNWYHSVTTS